MIRAHCLLVLLPVLAGCSPESARPAEAPAPAASASQTVTLAGQFHIVWNTQPHYFVTDSAGATTELLISEEVARAAGGPTRLNGRRVRVQGERVIEPRAALRVTSIQPEPQGR